MMRPSVEVPTDSIVRKQAFRSRNSVQKCTERFGSSFRGKSVPGNYPVLRRPMRLKSDSQCFERIADVTGRRHMHRGQSARPRSLDVFGKVIEEYDSLGRHSDRGHEMVEGMRIRLAQADAGRQVQLVEMAEQVGVFLREIVHMRPV